MNVDLILKILGQYLEKNPQIVEDLIGQAFQALVNALKAHNATPPAA